MLDSLNTLLSGKSLSRTQAEDVMSQMIDEVPTREQIGAFLMAIRMRQDARSPQDNTSEILGFLDCLDKRSIHVPLMRDDVMDVCGTGGDRAGTFNVSTTAVFVLAACGLPIAKHGNRSVSSKSGSFDVLEALGLHSSFLKTEPAAVAASIREFGLAFLFAPSFHPGFKSLAPIRKNLGIYTVFNALGPLLNPVRVRRQLIGVYSPLLLNQMAEVLRSRGSEEAMIVRGEDGLDEISLSGPTEVAHLRDGLIRNYRITPADFGLNSAPVAALAGGTAQENAEILLRVLNGEQGPKRDMVLINSAAALCIGKKAADFKEGVQLAEAAIDSGRAVALLERMRKPACPK